MLDTRAARAERDLVRITSDLPFTNLLTLMVMAAAQDWWTGVINVPSHDVKTLQALSCRP